MKKRIKKVSMQDIADRLNISKNSVALALNNKKGVSEELKAKIIETAIQLGYGGIDRSLAKEKNLLLIIPEYLHEAFNFYHEIILGIERSAQKKNMRVFMATLEKEKEKALELPSAYYGMHVDGIVLLGVFDRQYVEKISQLNVPFITVDQTYSGMKHNNVVTANMEGSSEVVRHLIEKGHESIGFIGPIRSTASNYERWLGYRKAMEEANLAIDPRFCFTESDSRSYVFSEIDAYISSLDAYPTAWFCANDYMAFYLIDVLQRRGLAVPDDISVAGFDDIDASRFHNPKLTTFHVRRDWMSEATVELLAASMKEEIFPRQIRIYGELVERESVKPLRDGVRMSV